MIVHGETSKRSQDSPNDSGQPPKTIDLPFGVSSPIIALGGDMKCCVYAIKERAAWEVESFENLEDGENYRRFVRFIDALCAEFCEDALILAHDMHPALLTTTYARGHMTLAPQGNRVQRCTPVQHHHAHIMSCAAEHGLRQPVVGIACDGNGYGADGHNWGCEVMVADANKFMRFGHLDYFGLPGGDAAALEPWRSALSLLWLAFEGRTPPHIERIFAGVPRTRLDGVRALLAHHVSCPLSSSLGRLFDAVSFLCGLCEQHSRDGQAARLLQSVADEDAEPYPYFEMVNPDRRIIDPRPLIQAVCCDLTEHVSISQISGRFHATIAQALSKLALQAACDHEIDTVVVSGGCFMNQMLSDLVCRGLVRGGVNVFKHEKVSCGDAGLGLGQAVIASAQYVKK